MTIHILIGALTISLLLILRRELVAAIREPTPGRSLTIISMAYVVGAMLVEWRDDSAFAVPLYAAYTLHFVMYLVGFYMLSAAMRLRLDPASPPMPDGNEKTQNFGKWAFFIVVFAFTATAVF